MLRKYITNNIQRYTHSHSSSSNKSPNLDNTIHVKMDKIMLQLDNIDIFLKFNYGITLIFGIISLFK